MYMTTKFIIESPRSQNKLIEFVKDFESLTNNIFYAKSFDTHLGANEYMRKVKFKEMNCDPNSFQIVPIQIR